jgi:hypothetical protein
MNSACSEADSHPEKMLLEYIPNLFNNQVGTFTFHLKTLDFSRTSRYTYDQITFDHISLSGHMVIR